MAVRDGDGLLDFSDEEREHNDDDKGTGLNFDPNEGDDDGLDDDVNLRDLLQIDDEDYEDEEEDSDDSGEEDSEEDESETTPDDTFKNEENARNAERRRQEEALRNEQIRQQSPEYQMIQRLSEISGKSPEQMMAELEEANIQRQAVQQGVPLELYRRTYQAEQAAKATQQRLQQLEFDSWNSRVDQDRVKLQADLPMLDQNDFDQAKAYILQTLKNTSVPLEQAVYALHGKKIADGLKDHARTETLAEVSGRKKSSGIPLSTKPAKQSKGLTDAERAAARALGMSAADYQKYRY